MLVLLGGVAWERPQPIVSLSWLLAVQHSVLEEDLRGGQLISTAGFTVFRAEAGQLLGIEELFVEVRLLLSFGIFSH